MENATTDNTTFNVETKFQGSLSVIVVFVANLILIIGIPTNMFLSTAINFSRRKLRNLNNFIIANIAVCGLIQLIAVIPWQFYSFITGTWPSPFWFCRCTLIFAVITVDGLINNMELLAIYRYFVVVRRQNNFIRSKKVVFTMVAIA